MGTHVHVHTPAGGVRMGTHVHVQVPQPGVMRRLSGADSLCVTAFLRLLCSGFTRRASGRVGGTTWGWEPSRGLR